MLRGMERWLKRLIMAYLVQHILSFRAETRVLQTKGMMSTLNYIADKGQDVIDALCRTVIKTRWGQLKCWQHWDAEWDERESDEERQKKEKTGSVCVVSGGRTNSVFCVCLLLPGMDISEWPVCLSFLVPLSVLFQVKWLFSRDTVGACVRVAAQSCHGNLSKYNFPLT